MRASFKALVRDSEALPLLPAKEAAHLSQYLDISARWLTFSQTSLPCITALASRPYRSDDDSQSLWLRHFSFYLLLSLRNRVNHHTLQQGLAALLSYYRLKREPEQQKQRYMSAIRQLTRCKQHYWAAHLLPSSKRKNYQDCFDVAWLWHRYLLRLGSSGYNTLLQKLAMTLPSAAQKLLNPLIDYPGVLHEGMCIQLDGQSCPVISQLPDKILIFQNHDKTFNWLDKRRCTIASRQSLSVHQWIGLVEKLASQPEDGEVVRAGDHAWALPTSFPTARPPASLQALLKALNDPDVPIQKIVELVGAEPSFTHFLTDAASRDNRMQLSVSDVKQSILTYGLERVGHMLVQYALFQRLTQHWFPLLDNHSRLARIAIQLSSELASSQGEITPQYASLVTTVALSPLFTSSDEKIKMAVPAQTIRLFDVNSLIETTGQNAKSDTRQRLLSLAIAWEQDKGQSRLIACCGKMPDEVPGLLRLPHCISGISLIWAREWLLGHIPCEQTKCFVQQTQTAFPALETMKQSLRASVSHLLYCSLP